MPVRLNGSISGYSELSAPAVAGNNTITLPTGNGTSGQVLTTNGSGALSWGVGVSSDSQLCKAWVNFNGTGTVAIRASYNVSSITDNGTGDYTVNFTTALVDVNYSANVTHETVVTTTFGCCGQTISGNSSSAYRLNTVLVGGSAVDRAQISVAIFR
jgi:hypothetical protein